MNVDHDAPAGPPHAAVGYETRRPDRWDTTAAPEPCPDGSPGGTAFRAAIPAALVRRVIRPWRVPSLLGGAVAAFAMWLVLNDAGATVRAHVADLTYVALDLAVGVLAWSAARRCTVPRLRRGCTLFAAAMASRVLADGLWWWIEAVRHESPFPSAADLGYVSFYLLTLAAVWSLGRRQAGIDRSALALDLGIVGIGALMAVWYLLIAEITASPAPLVQEFLAVAYPVGDAVLLTGAAALWLRRSADLPRGAVVALISGLGAWALADIGWTRLSLGGGYAGGDWIDLVWLAALAAWGIAAHLIRTSPDAPERPAAGTSRGEQFLPYSGMALGVAVMLVATRDLPFLPYAPVIAGVTTLVVLVTLRQGLVKRQHVALIERYHQLATIDSLTGLYGRQSLIDLAQREMARSRREGKPLGLLMIDVDHFKAVNDTLGHAAGDAVLRHVAQLCSRSLRDADVLGRVGGDEFVALLPGTDNTGGLVTAGKLADRLAAENLVVDGTAITVTLSIGVTDTAGAESLTALLARADAALYQAKAHGRAQAVAIGLAAATDATAPHEGEPTRSHGCVPGNGGPVAVRGAPGRVRGQWV